MATVSLSPTPAPLSTTVMSAPSRRNPLSTNPNAANSPLRGAAMAVAQAAKQQKRSYNAVQRDDVLGQPPAKKLVLDAAAATPRDRLLKSPSQSRASRIQAGASSQLHQPQKRTISSSYESKLAKERAIRQQQAQNNDQTDTQRKLEDLRQWQRHHRMRFPNYVFYFESIPDDVRAKLVKQIVSLGAREERFFSINITHVVTTRQIPPENARPAQEEGEDEASEATSQQHEQPQTINPSLLNRSADVSRRLLLENIVPARRPLPQGNDDVIRRPIKAKNADLLIRARGMGKKIWSLEKLQRMLNLLVPEMSNSASAPYGALSGAAAGSLGASRPSEEANIAQLLHKERRNGPSDRDPTVGTQELHRFRGRYIYVYDIDEKVKPIMVREYAKVADNRDGDWPQFRTVSGGKCPFVEEPEAEKESHRQQQAARAAEAAETTAQPAEEDAAKASMAKTVRSVTGKRTLAEMESAQNRGASVGASTATATGIPALDTAQPLNAFTSRAAPARLLAGEPVASGLQQSNVTSAIRSQMISSATGAGGAKAGTSREMHSLLQRKVLQKNSLSYRTPAPLATATTAAGTESAAAAAAALGTAGVRGHRAAEELARTATAAVAGQDAAAVRRRPRLDEVASAGNVRSRKSVVDAAKAEAASMAAPPRPKKRDPKPGYCENCQERFEDFDDHIVSEKHRMFAEDDSNWVELDNLLAKLVRPLKRRTCDDFDED